MKHLILAEILLLFLATTFQSDSTGGWVQQTLPRTDITVQDIFFIDSLKGWVVTRKNTNDSAFIYQTIDGGINWTTQFAKNVYLTSIQFTDSNTGYTVGSAPPGIIYKTTNGGLSWYLAASSSAYPFVDVKFVNNDTGWVCSDDGLDGGVFKTTNGGINWQPELNNTYRPSKLFFLNKDTGWVSCNQNSLYRTTNSGTSWDFQFNFPQQVNDIYFFNSLIGVVSSVFNQRTTDGGFTWTQTNDGGIKLSFVNDSIGWAGSNFSKIMKTISGGNSWFRQSSPIFDNSSTSSIDTLKAWAGGTGTVHTTDGGGPPVGINEISNEIPNGYRLYQNYPNPFNPVTNIKYNVKRQTSLQKDGGQADVKLIVYDARGRQVAELVNQKQNAGTYQVDFDGSNLPSGVYFCQLIIGDELTAQAYKETKKMIMVK